MQDLYEALQYLVAFAFVFLAVVAARQWFDRRDGPTKWLALTFLSIGLIAAVGVFQPEDPPDTTFWEWFIKIEILILIAFPYLLFRFAATFGSVSRRTETIGAGLLAIVALWTLLLPEFPEPDTEPTGQFLYYTWALLAMWTILSLIVTYKLWVAGRDQPPLSRRRMRMLSVGSALLSIVLLVSGTAETDEATPLSIGIQLLTLVSALTFYFGFSTPAALRATWRKPSEDALRRAISELMVADSEEEVSRAWFPHVTGIVGAKGVVAMRTDGSIIGSHGVDPGMLAGLTRVMDEGGTSNDVVHLRFPFGTMTVWASPYTPFFGSDEVELIESLGALANLAFERVHSAQLRSQLEHAQMRRQQALEINDNVVQGLTVAKLAFDLGDRDKAMKALQETLISARGIITRLLQDIEDTDEIKPGQLVRGAPATVGDRSGG